MKNLSFICVDDFGMPVYKDESGRLWKDTNLGNGVPDLHSSSTNEIDGEPDSRITGEYEIIDQYTEHPEKLNYQILSKLKMDCDYYLGHGNKNQKHLWAGNVADHIEEMKRMWNNFSVADKPEWLTFEQICQYEEKMLGGS